MNLLNFAVVLSVYAGAMSQQNVDIRLPPTITVQNEETVQVLQEATQAILECEANGEPAPEYEWLYDGNVLDLNHENIETVEGVGTIKVVLGPLQEGSYQCFASNQHGTTMTDINYLLRAILAGFPPVEDRHLYVQEGESLIIQCDSTMSVPEPLCSWQTVETRDDKDPISISLDRRVQQDDKGNLYFAYVTPTDAQSDRLYRCVTTNRNFGGSKFGSYTTVEVTPGSVPNSKPANLFHTGHETGSQVIAIKGRTLRLQCLFSGLPVPTISWKKKNGALPNNRHSTENYDTTLVITDVQDVDEGTYTCTGRNSEGPTDKDISVDVQSVPMFMMADDSPSNMNVTQSQDAVFRCATEAEEEADIQWYINGEALTDLPPRVVLEDNDRSLRVMEACKDCESTPSDLKVYQCNASNAHGYVFAAGYLNVLLPTVMIRPPEDVLMEYGTDVKFECEGGGDDSTPLSITWYKDHDRPINAVPDRISLEDDNEVLIIHHEELQKPEHRYEGEYTCVISNGYSTVNATASLTRPAEPIPTAPPTDPDCHIVVVVVVNVVTVSIAVFATICITRRTCPGAVRKTNGSLGSGERVYFNTSDGTQGGSDTTKSALCYNEGAYLSKSGDRRSATNVEYERVEERGVAGTAIEREEERGVAGTTTEYERERERGIGGTAGADYVNTASVDSDTFTEYEAMRDTDAIRSIPDVGQYLTTHKDAKHHDVELRSDQIRPYEPLVAISGEEMDTLARQNTAEYEALNI